MKKTFKIISFLIVLLLVIVGGVLPNLPKAFLEKLPSWAFWVGTITGIVFIIFGIALHFIDEE